MSIQHDHKYFVQDQTTRGKEKKSLFKPTEKGTKMQNWTSNCTIMWIKWRGNTTTMIDSKSTRRKKKMLQNYQQILQHSNFGTNTFCIPKNQACKNIRVNHWDCECPYPYGNKELHIPCKICSIDLKIYKLVNQAWLN